MIPNLARRLAGGVLLTAIVSTAAACAGSTATTAPVASQAATAASSVAPTAAPTTGPTTAASPTAGASLATSGRIEFADKGFAVTLPDGWTRIDLQAQDLDALLKAAGESNPALAQAQSAQIKSMLAAGLVLFALGPTPMSGANVNILVVPSLGLSMDLLEQANLAQVKALANGTVTSDRVTLPAGEALHFKYAINVGNLPTAASIEQYMILTDQQQYIVSVTNGQAGDAEAIAKSIELLH
jgi:hypothetical protein